MSVLLRVAGVDEAGRGCLAGPVVAAAVVLAGPIAGLRDSKRLSAAARARRAVQIKAEALAWGIGQASVIEIDTLNILQASLLAMRRAVAALPWVPDAVEIDGNQDPDGGWPTTCWIGGDDLRPAIMAASILAKTTRDEWMLELDARNPEYGFALHKGYGTPQHLAALAARGPGVHHRMSFAPCQRARAACAA
ncbi:MAG: ribonuclease HII [Polycyclovorans sp.]|nr:ribonuclease HII [Gammaproteobacteria bacterium]MDP1543223.1 ribonuclease HII [Polycyclovorans sp.]|tara:strand:+ start:1563 stop:2141 length:579 start_codon:yes stop_codon:yes gene_type:complete